jgi:hypothetical protein
MYVYLVLEFDGHIVVLFSGNWGRGGSQRCVFLVNKIAFHFVKMGELLPLSFQECMRVWEKKQQMG